MTGGATAADITAGSLLKFQLIMFAVPVILLVLAAFVYRGKVTLTEEEHARIVEELEEKWEDMNK
jgi:lactose/raffinose/galactose permease